jgi:hypothetical protein
MPFQSWDSDEGVRIIIIIIIKLFSYHGFSFPWYYSSWANDEPHNSGFKSHIVALSLWGSCTASFCRKFIIIIIVIIIIIIIKFLHFQICLLILSDIIYIHIWVYVLKFA